MTRIVNSCLQPQSHLKTFYLLNFCSFALSVYTVLSAFITFCLPNCPTDRRVFLATPRARISIFSRPGGEGEEIKVISHGRFDAVGDVKRVMSRK